MQARILTNQGVIAEKCHVAVSYWDRLRGLMGKSGLAPGHGMWFPRCKSVHLWWMRFAIDVVFVRPARASGAVEREPRWVITSLHARMQPWRALPVTDLRATEAIELPEGTAEKFGLKPGDELEVAWVEERIA